MSSQNKKLKVEFLLVIFCIIQYNNDYMENKEAKCVVLDLDWKEKFYRERRQVLFDKYKPKISYVM